MPMSSFDIGLIKIVISKNATSMCKMLKNYFSRQQRVARRMCKV
jgi:hypothetical protein